MNFKIRLVSPYSACVEDDNLEQHLGLAYIASYLRFHQFDAQVTELTGNSGNAVDGIVSQIPTADVFGISCYSTNYNSVKAIVRHIRVKYPLAYVCLGGPHPTAMPNESLGDLNADGVICGEGEGAFLDLVEKISKGLKPTGVFKEKPITNLDRLPFPDRDLLEKKTHTRMFHGQKTVSLISSRGCRHKCRHCNSVIMGGGSRNVRFRSKKNMPLHQNLWVKFGSGSLPSV